MVSRREYLSFALYVTLAFSVADPSAGIRSTARSIEDFVMRETKEARSLLAGLDPDERGFLARYALCAASDPLDLVKFSIETYQDKEPTSRCVDLSQ